MKSILSCVIFILFLIPLKVLAQKKYNVIMIAADDLNIQFDLYGNPDVHAPNIARLAEHGMLFTQAYCQYALCSPSRSSVMSGKRPDATGVYANEIDIRNTLGADYKFMPEYFDFYGYRTEKFGKVASCKHEDEIYWDFVLTGQGEDRFGLRGTPDWWIDTTRKDIKETVGYQIADAAIQKIRQPLEYPYYYGIGLSSHNPYTPILSSWNQIGDPGTQELLPVNLNGDVTNIIGNGSANISLPNTPVDDTTDIPFIALKDPIYFPPDEVQRIKHGYYGEIVELDTQLGAVLDVLDSMNLWDSTVVVFWSDHGIHLGEHLGQWLKLTLFEEALRVPFIICAPGKKPGVCNTPVELVDMFSTLNELCGLPVQPDQQGSSLVPLLENPGIPWKKAIFAQVERDLGGLGNKLMGRSARTNDFHYNIWGTFGEELYDIKNDPLEYNNLAKNGAYAAVLDSMRNILTAGWQAALPPVYTKRTFYKDADKDGFGVLGDSASLYFIPDGYAEKFGDCNDLDASVNPGAKEKPCNLIDDNCNKKVDENRPAPSINHTGSLDICQAGSVQLKTAVRSGFTYQWKRNGVNIPGATGNNYVASNVGIYKVVITYLNSCSNISDGTTVFSSCSSVSDNEESNSSDKLTIIPNPSSGIITLSYENSSSKGDIDLKIYDRIGNLVFTKSEQSVTGTNNYKLNLSMLQPGVYQVQLNNGLSVTGSKLIIER